MNQSDSWLGQGNRSVLAWCQSMPILCEALDRMVTKPDSASGPADRSFKRTCRFDRNHERMRHAWMSPLTPTAL